MLKQPTQIRGSVYSAPTLSAFVFNARNCFLQGSKAEGITNETIGTGDIYDDEWL